eukprot:COSAG06_NODE_485_length_15117_cov_5.922493_8_plen_212_part_00
MTSGPCTVTDGGACFRTPNYPDAYGYDQDCEIAVVSGAGFVQATAFDTVAMYDYVAIGDNHYSGSGGALGSDGGGGVPVGAGAAVAWHADFSGERTGAEVCGLAREPTRADFAERYTVSGCANPAHCGTFVVVQARCTSGDFCPGGAYARPGWTDATMCDGVPTYQRAAPTAPCCTGITTATAAARTGAWAPATRSMIATTTGGSPTSARP